jgi:membrane protein implicated in regulation of membrane protease activity
MANLPENAWQIALVLGFTMLIIDIMVFGFATLVLTFLGLGLLTLGGVIYLFDIESYTVATAVLSASTAVITACLWKPLKVMTQKTSTKVAKSDFHGLTFELSEDIGAGKTMKYKYSGISWNVDSRTLILQGTLVVVTDVEVGKMWVAPKH